MLKVPKISRSCHAVQKIKSTLLRYRLGKITQNIFNRWLFITTFIIRNSALFIFHLIVLFINQIYLLHLDKCRWKEGFE